MEAKTPPPQRSRSMVPPSAFSQTLFELYPQPLVHLWYDQDRPWTMLFAVIMSAQCTDARVNLTTPGLFTQFPTLQSLVDAGPDAIRQAIASISFPGNKSKHIHKTAQILLTQHQGKVPKTMAELTALPGVGRKTANVVAHVLHGVNLGFVVDTHIKRIAYRVGHTRHTEPTKIEPDLKKRFPQNQWGDLAHKMVQFGRDICPARNPKCHECPFAGQCPRRGV